MARRIKPRPATQESVDALSARVESGFIALNATLVRFAADVDRRFAKTATIDMLSDVKATVDGHTGVLDHVVGELQDLRESRVVFSAMYKAHGTRLSALESRQPPPTP